MTQLTRIAALGLLCLLAAAQAAQPKITVSVTRGVAATAARITVEASDTEGLDSLEITSPQADTTYHTQLSRSTVSKQFKRSFTLPELFAVTVWKEPVRLEVKVRNTRGATSSTTIQVP